MLLSTEEEARKRARDALLARKSFHDRCEENRCIVEEVRAKLAKEVEHGKAATKRAAEEGDGRVQIAARSAIANIDATAEEGKRKIKAAVCDALQAHSRQPVAAREAAEAEAGEAEASEEELRPDTAEGVVTEISVQPAATENPELPEQQVTLTLPEGQQKPFNAVKKDFYDRADFIGLDLDAADAWAVKFNRNWPEALEAMGKLYKDDIDTLNREAYASRKW